MAAAPGAARPHKTTEGDHRTNRNTVAVATSRFRTCIASKQPRLHLIPPQFVVPHDKAAQDEEGRGHQEQESIVIRGVQKRIAGER